MTENNNSGTSSDVVEKLSEGGESRLFATFSIGELFFGIDVDAVQEVSRFQQMTSVPLAPQSVSGLINLRGQIVTSIDMRKQLELEPLPEDTKPMNIVVRDEGEAVNLLVDEIGDVLEVNELSYEATPDSLTDRQKELITGVYKLEDKLLLILDTHRAVLVYKEEDNKMPGGNKL